MKKNMKFLIGGLFGIILIAALYFGTQGEPLQGKIFLSKNITRAELAKLIAETMGTEDNFSNYSNGCGYSDLKANEWYTGYACYLIQKNIMAGYPDDTFQPSKSITRGEAAVAFFNAFAIAKGPGGLPVLISVYFYQDIYNDDDVTYSVNALAPYGMWDIKPGKEENFNNPTKQPKFYPEKNLTVGRAQVWSKNFKKAVELYQTGYEKALK